MNWILRIILAVLVGLLATGLLDWAGALNHGLNVLIGVILALLFYFGYPDNPRV